MLETTDFVSNPIHANGTAIATTLSGGFRLLNQMRALVLVLIAASVGSSGCGFRREPGPTVTPVYNGENGKLEQLLSDRDGDGKAETRAFMDGAILRRIEIDRDGDGRPDRWEFYLGAPAATRGVPIAAPIIERAEEANGPDGHVTRREFYNRGLIQRVEDDTDANGRIDKWESYEGGELVRVELDLIGKGNPTQRLVYGLGGAVIRVESDPDGDGKFEPVQIRDQGE